jgi:hypothetical protein
MFIDVIKVTNFFRKVLLFVKYTDAHDTRCGVDKLFDLIKYPAEVFAQCIQSPPQQANRHGLAIYYHQVTTACGRDSKNAILKLHQHGGYIIRITYITSI